MIQQINLYQGRLKKSQNKPAIYRYIYGSVTALVLLIGFSLYILSDLNNTKSSLKKTKQQLREAETQVKVLQIQYPQKQINPLLSQELSRLQNIVGSLSRVIHLLNDKESDQTQGFSRYFSALAKQGISDVWLSNISIDAKKHTIKLEGSTYNTEKIPVFIQALHHEPVFQGKNFAKLVITQDKGTENQVNFTINTTTEIFEQEEHD